MGLNLRKLKEGILAQYNPFDGGKTFDTVYRGTPVAPRQNSQPRQVQSFGQNQQTTFGAPTPSRTDFSQPNRPEVNSFIGAVIGSKPANKPNTVAFNQPTNQFTMNKPGNVQIDQGHAGPATKADYENDLVGRTLATLSRGVGRSGVGTAQSVSGFIDAVSPGKGTSRVTQSLNKTAEGIDQSVKDLGMNSGIYKLGQAGADIATFLLPGAALPKGVIKGSALVSKIPGATKTVTKLAKGADAISKSGKAGKTIVATGKYLTRPDVVANTLTDTVLNTGFRGARGQDISPGTVAIDYGMSAGAQGALTGVGKGAKWTVNKVADKLISDDVLKPKTLNGLVSDSAPQATAPAPKTAKSAPVEKTAKTDPLEALKAEARKYKSADEFRKNLIYNDDIILHQTGKDTASKISKEGFKAGKETGLGEKRGEVYGMSAWDWNKHSKFSKGTYARDGSGVAEVAIDTRGLKIADRTKQKFTDEEYVKGIHKQIPEGYDGVKVGYGNGVNEVLLKPEVANARRFSIDDLYNQATKGAKAADPLEALKQEARKYKSADEFVASQGKPLYHGSNKRIKDLPKLSTQPETNDMMGKAFYVTDSKNHGGYYARRKNGNIVNELVPTKGANIVGFDDSVSNKLRNEQSLPVWVKTNRDAYNYLKVDKGIDDPNTIFAKSGVDGFTQRLSKYDPNNQLLKEQGDSLYTAIINPKKLQTKAQLTDLYNQATAPVEKTATPDAQNAGRLLSVDEAASELKAAQLAKEADMMKYKGIEKLRAKGRQISEKLFNPYAEGERFTSKLAKAMGISTKKINARQDLAHLLDVVANSGTATADLADRTGLSKVISKYPPGSDEETRFITYLMAKRDLDVRANKGVKILPYDDAQVGSIVSEYEAMNPNAIKDLATINNHFKVLLRDALDSKTITKADYDKALATEDFYAPVARVTGAEDVLRPTVNANAKGSLNKQHAIQTLTGSDSPVNTTWDAIVGGTHRIVRENARNRAFNLMYDAADQGFVDDMVRMGMSKEQSSALLGLRDLINDLQQASGELGKTIKSTSKKLKVASKKSTAYNNKVQDKAINNIATLLETSGDPDGAAALRGLGRKDQKQLIDWIQTGMTDYQVGRQTKLNQATQDVYRNLMGQRAAAENLVAETGAAKRGASELQLLKDKKAGKQTISGFVDGYPVWLETTPEMAKMIQGLEPQDLGPVTKFVGNVNHIWRTFWTGLFNPVFAVKSKLFYDQPMLFLNQSGSRNQLRPNVMAGALGDNFTDVGGFFNKLKQYGVAPVTGSRVIGDTKQTAELLAAHNDFQSKLGYYARHPKAALEALDVIGGKLAHGSRMQAARAEYQKALAQNLPEEDALANAARAYNNILPNYGRTSKTLRAIDAWIPYANAGVAGTRSMTGAMKRDPIGWSAKASAFATALAATGVYAMSDETTKDFYQDMYDTNQQSVLQNNIVIALPGASKDPETGQWSGIIKVPIPPEFRAPNALIQDSAFKSNGGDATVGDTQDAYNPTTGALASLATSGTANIGRGGGIAVEVNPAASAALELGTNKRNTGMGDPFAYGDAKYLPRNEQINKDTSQAAISGANLFNKLSPGDKVDISPAALDEQMKSFGIGGKVVRSVASGALANENTTKDQLPGTDIKKSVIGTVVASNKGMTDTKWHFKNQDAVKSTLTTENQRTQFSILNSKNDSPGDAQAKSQLLYESLQGDGTLWNAQKKQNELDAAKSGISNPLFKLTPEQARAVTLYRGNARLTAAKQTYAKDGSSLFQSLGLDEKWYQDFKNKEADFYAKIDAKKDDPNTASIATAAKTYSGKAPEKPSVVIQSKLDKYYTLPKGTGARTAFLKANPDIVAYWDSQNALTNEERLAMGLDLLGDGGTNGGGYGGYGYGSRGGSGGNNAGYDNPYKYVVSGAYNKPTRSNVKLTGASAKRGVAMKAPTKPKVSIKKSLT